MITSKRTRDTGRNPTEPTLRAGGLLNVVIAIRLTSEDSSMIRLALASIALIFSGAVLVAEPPKATSKLEQKAEVDTFAELVQTLHTKKVKFPNSLKDTPLRTLKEQLEKQFEMTFVVREDLFKLQGEADGEIMDRKFKLDSNLSGIPLEAFLRLVLQDIKATFLIRKHYVEITTWEAAAAHADDPVLASILKANNSDLASEAVRNFIRDTPLVSTVVKDRPFERAVGELADTYGFTVIVAVEAVDLSKTNVSARLMNVPFPTALDVLALNAGLKVVRRDNTFIVTTVEHAGTLKAKAAKPVKK